MGTTSPDALGYPDVGYTSGIRQAVKDLADTVQTALLGRASRTFRPADATALAALSSSYTLRADDRAYQVDTGVTYRYNGSAWKAWESDWITYTPTLSNLTIGTGGSATSVARYRYQGGLVEVELKYVLGSSGASVGTTPSFTLPVTAEAATHTLMIFDGMGSMWDTSANDARVAFTQQTSTTAARFAYITPSGSGFSIPTATAPWTWAAGDAFHQVFRYVAA